MTLFEYLSVAVSIVLSLALVRLITGVGTVATSHAVYWVHTLWIVVVLGLCLAHWWTSWSFREAQWTFVLFVVMLTGPAVLYFVATVLVPDDPGSIENWSDYFYAKRLPLFAGLTFYAILITFDGYLILDAPLSAPARGGQIAAVALALTGVASRKPGVHAVVVCAFTLLFVTAALSLIAQPDAMTSQ